MNEGQSVEELRLRLDKRNKLLDIIRRAYHRDVVVVREYLLQLHKGVNIDEIKSEDLNLRSIPSIDLRNDGFHIFSPEQCELTVRPCFHCGGRLEITHRESARFQTLMESCNGLKVREKDLNTQLEDAKQRIEDGKLAMLKQEVCLIEEQNRLNTEIDRLTKSQADRDNLDRLCRKQETEIEALNIIRVEKERLEVELRKTELELSGRNADCQRARNTIAENNTMNNNLKKRVEEGLLRERGLNNRVEQMDCTIKDLRKNVETLEALEIQLKGEINACRTEIRRQNATIRVTEEAKTALEQQLASTIDERNATVSDLERNLKSANEEIKKLKKALDNEQQDAQKFRNDTQLEFRQQREVEKDRAAKDGATIDELTRKVNDLTNLTSSHIQGLYDQCLEQEQILHLEGAMPSTLPNKILSPGTAIKPLQHIENKLAQKMDSVHINWEMMLNDDYERRMVFGNLNNRTQMNLGHIDNLIKRLHAKHKNELKRVNKRNEERMEESCAAYDGRIALLDTQAEERNLELREVTTRSLDVEKKLSSALSDIESLEEMKTKHEETITGLEGSLSDANLTIVTIEETLEKTKSDLDNTVALLKQTEIDVRDRDETLIQLEVLLQKTTNRFAQKMEQERHRLETNQNVSIQAEPLVDDFQQQVDFIKNVIAREKRTIPSTSAAQNAYPTAYQFFE